jgi:hypothetical protein
MTGKSSFLLHLRLENFLPVGNFFLLGPQKSFYFPSFTAGISIALTPVGIRKEDKDENKNFAIGCCHKWALGRSARGLVP